jgi:hypothetical protein
MESADIMDEDEDEIIPQDLTKNREERVKYKYSGLGHLDGDSANEACAEAKYNKARRAALYIRVLTRGHPFHRTL